AANDALRHPDEKYMTPPEASLTRGQPSHGPHGNPAGCCMTTRLAARGGAINRLLGIVAFAQQVEAAAPGPLFALAPAAIRRLLRPTLRGDEVLQLVEVVEI